MKTTTGIGWITIAGAMFGCMGPFDHDHIIGIGDATGGYGPTTNAAQSQGGSIVWQAGGATSTTCSSSTDLIAEAANSPDGNWIEADGCGVQGAIYAYSDDGLDGVMGSSDDSLQSPPTVSPGSAERISPCAGGRCCISGATSLWPMGSDGRIDYTASVWGSGLGISLNDDGVTKSAYTGPARGFNIVLSGTLNGQALRLAYTQLPIDSAAPFAPAKLGVNQVRFDDVTCPTWAATCVAPSLHPYDLQLQVVGGDTAGDYSVCIVSVTPIF